MEDDATPSQPLADLLERKLTPTPGLKAKQERLLKKLASGSELPTQSEQWTPEQEHEDGKFRRARLLQALKACK